MLQKVRKRADPSRHVLVHVRVVQRRFGSILVDVDATTLIASPILVHIGVGQCRRALDVESSAILLRCLICVHVRIGQRCNAQDIQSSAISATLPTVSTRDVPVGRWN